MLWGFAQSRGPTPRADDRRLIGRRPKRQKADLGPVAVGHNDLVPPGHLGDGRRGYLQVLPLPLNGKGLTPLEEGVAAQGQDHAHRCNEPTLPVIVQECTGGIVGWADDVPRGRNLDETAGLGNPPEPEPGRNRRPVR